MIDLDEFKKLDKAATQKWSLKFTNYRDGGLDLREREIVGANFGSLYPLSEPEGKAADADYELAVFLRNNAKQIIRELEASRAMAEALRWYEQAEYDSSTTGDTFLQYRAEEALIKYKEAINGQG